jgi:hypothetical protein
MKQLMPLKKYKDASANDVEQQQLLDRMKSTIGVAVGNMETVITAGTIWCPSSQDNIVTKTPQKSNKISYHISSSSSAKRKIQTSSTERDFSNYSESDSEEYTTCQSEKKSFCCTKDYFWKEDVK